MTTSTGLAGLELDGAGVVDHLLQGDQPFGLEAHIDHHVLVGQLDDRALDDLVAVGLDGGGLGGLLALEGFESRRKVLHGLAVLGMTGMPGGRGRRSRGGNEVRGGRLGNGRFGDRRSFSRRGLNLGGSGVGRLRCGRRGNGFSRRGYGFGGGIGVQRGGCGRFRRGSGLGVGRGFGRRLLALRRRVKGWGFQFGVQGYALGFRIEDVRHHC